MDKYCYKDTDVLINKFDIMDNAALKDVETRYSDFRIAELVLKSMPGPFDLKYLQNIHKHIFQDLYPWAGEIRTVEIGKGYTQFANSSFIIPESKKLFDMLKSEANLVGYPIDEFSKRLSYYAAELNILHPFREGNGRSIREYIRTLAENAGYQINYSLMDKEVLTQAFIKSIVDTDDLYKILKENILVSLKKSLEKEWPAARVCDENFLSRISNYARKHFEDKTINITAIKEEYARVGKLLESAGQKIDSSFAELSELVNDIRRFQAQWASDERTKGLDFNKNKGLNQEM